MEYPEITAHLLALRKADEDLRNQLIATGRQGDGYQENMRRLHDRNATQLAGIMEEIGYPTADRVGEAGTAAAWLVIQHAIGRPDFMRSSRELLAAAVREGRGDPVRLAYLTDRIAVFEGRPQRYGTQFDWDEAGRLSPQPLDDPARVDRRRRELGLPGLEAHTAVMRARAAGEGQVAPTDYAGRRREMDHWRKEVGWI